MFLENVTFISSKIYVFLGSDETFVQISPAKEKVLGNTGTKNVFLVHKCSEKSNVFYLATVSASGCILPPFIIYPYKRYQPWMAKTKNA